MVGSFPQTSEYGNYPNDAFYSELRDCNPLENKHTNSVNLLQSGLTAEEAVIKLKLTKPPPNVIENYQYPQQIWKQEQMNSIKEFCSCITAKTLCQLRRQRKKMIDFNHDKDIGILKFGCRLPNMANSCAHKSTDANLSPFTEADKDMLEKIRKDVVGDLFLVFTQSGC